MHSQRKLPSLVSVVIPCYNAASFLRETVESVFAQSYPHIEIIIVDDGSTDDTRQLIEAYEDRVSAIYSTNQGAASARNIGTQVAAGEFIQYLDADDLLKADAIENRVKILLASGADVAYSDWQKLAETDAGVFILTEITARRIEDVHSNTEIALFTQFWAPPAALLYRKTLVEKIGAWKQQLAPIEDARFMLDAALMGGKFIHAPGVSAFYRIYHAPSHSRRSPLKFVQAVFNNACEIEAWWMSHDTLDSPHLSALADAYDYTSRALFKHDDKMFDDALKRLYTVKPGFQPSWSKMAGMLKNLIGRSRAIRMLDMIGKPAQ